MQSYTNFVQLLVLVTLIMAISTPAIVQARVLRKYAMNVAPPATQLEQEKVGDADKPLNNEQLRRLKLQQQQESDPEINQDDIILPMERRSLGSLWAMERYG